MKCCLEYFNKGVHLISLTLIDVKITPFLCQNDVVCKLHSAKHFGMKTSVKQCLSKNQHLITYLSVHNTLTNLLSIAPKVLIKVLI